MKEQSYAMRELSDDEMLFVGGGDTGFNSHAEGRCEHGKLPSFREMWGRVKEWWDSL
jgi:hypothetical protein